MEKSTKKMCCVSNAELINSDFHFKRSRLTQTFTEAMKYPLIIVCAGAGYGKTTAVLDFVQEYQAPTVWVQLSERDNVGGRFWENFTHSMMKVDVQFAASIKKLGFPDTTEKLKQYINFVDVHTEKKRRIIVFDDCHFIKNPDVIRFVEEAIRNLPLGTSIFMISRSTLHLNIADMVSAGQGVNVNEDELRFTENELAQCFRCHDISLAPDSLRVIRQDTEGWAFALNYIIRSYKKAPGYEGYLRNAMKSNIFRFMETEVWNVMSESLQNFLVRLSLIDHLSIDLILLLAGEEADIADELEKQSAYVRRDNFINAFLIHPLFLEFLATKQDILSYEQKSKTYTIAGIWCNQNGFKIDALSYYEKIGDYKSIAYMFIDSPLHIQYDVACYAEAILDRAPQEAFDSVTFLASVHLRTIMCQGCFDKAGKKAAYYEKKYLNWKKNDTFKKMTMYSIYYCWALVRMAVCVSDEICDFDIYFEKLSNCIPEPSNSGNVIHRAPGPWFCALGSSKKGAVQDFIDAFVRSGEHLSKCSLDFRSGEDQLARGEFKFYQGDIQGAESFVANGLSRAREMKRSEIINRALFYALRIAVLQGNYNKAEKALQDMGAALDDPSYIYRFTEYDVSLCWYYCALGMPEKVPDWLKENFSLYAHAGFIENCANQMKARYCYQTRNYPPLLSYINEMKKRESYLFGRIEMLAIEACIHYKMKDKKNAYAAFKEAYDTALPNGIVMPFIELGKDMRTLTTCTLKNYKKIPTAWLEDINRKSASYAKRLTRIVTEYRQASGIADNIVISPRELEVLTDLSHGLSRTEIAVSRNLSINTVKMLVNNIYMKLGAENLVDAIRIAVERKII